MLMFGLRDEISKRRRARWSTAPLHFLRMVPTSCNVAFRFQGSLRIVGTLKMEIWASIFSVANANGARCGSVMRESSENTDGQDGRYRMSALGRTRKEPGWRSRASCQSMYPVYGRI